MTDTPQLLLDNQLCFRLYTASRLITQAYDSFLRPLGLTYTQYLVLLVLWECDHQPINTIAQRLRLGINTMSPLIKRMESMGLITREASTEDRRVQYIKLTADGRAMQQQAADIPNCLTQVMEDCGIETQQLLSLFPTLDMLIERLS